MFLKKVLNLYSGTYSAYFRMKPLFEKVLLSESSFLVKEEHFYRYDIPWHLHPEFELTLLIQGEGKKNIGDHISEIHDKELVLLGPNLPHSWFGSKTSKSDSLSKQIVIQFPYDFLGSDFFENHAFTNIRDLLQRSYRGLLFHDPEKISVLNRITDMLLLNDFDRTMELLHILNILAQSKRFEVLSSMGYSSHLNKSESARLNAIYGFILDHFKTGLDLNTVARFAGMTPQAFSRYFRERTRRTFISFLNEVRIGYACRLISEKRMNISQICYECGYTNLSNFNRQFKKIMAMPPTQYAKRFD